MASPQVSARRQKPRAGSQNTWRRIGRTAARWIAICIIALEVAALGLDSQIGPAGHLTAAAAIALVTISFVYLCVVAPKVSLELRGLGDPDGHPSPSGHPSPDEPPTIEVRRLSDGVALATVRNDSALPVLHAEMAVSLSPEDKSSSDDKTSASAQAGESRQASTKRRLGRKRRPAFAAHTSTFSIPARTTSPVATSSTFDHVGIFMLRSTGLNVHDLLDLFHRVRGATGTWRVRVVPNVYRLGRGIPSSRWAKQTSEGIPSTPADALDYDRVREFRPGDPLKHIHWKLVAHSRGELYTKLFETSTSSSATLLVDPFGPAMDGPALEGALHLHDTMLEGGFSLLEHGRESGVTGRVRFVNDAGQLVDADWQGLATLGWFVESARRPAPTEEARALGTRAIRSLQTGPSGYTIFSTSRLCDQSVAALIAAHHAGASLIVVHAVPSVGHRMRAQQEALDTRLRAASIGVIDLTDGRQIIQEVMAP